MGQQLETDGYHMLFIPDALAMAGGHDASTDTSIAIGAKDGIYLDPETVMLTVAAATNSLRLGCTISTSFLPPYEPCPSHGDLASALQRAGRMEHRDVSL